MFLAGELDRAGFSWRSGVCGNFLLRCSFCVIAFTFRPLLSLSLRFLFCLPLSLHFPFSLHDLCCPFVYIAVFSFPHSILLLFLLSFISLLCFLLFFPTSPTPSMVYSVHFSLTSYVEEPFHFPVRHTTSHGSRHVCIRRRHPAAHVWLKLSAC